MTARLEPPTKGIGIADAFVVGGAIVGQRHVLDVLEMVHDTHPRQGMTCFLACCIGRERQTQGLLVLNFAASVSCDLFITFCSHIIAVLVIKLLIFSLIWQKLPLI